ncbi:MAG: leucine-rich repeat domain-containing protein [Bacteroidia bacterium]|nr:leucine-rich repeat domain-containing protein [Bacteroidia bacterium]
MIGSSSNFYKNISEDLNYPVAARNNLLEGYVYILFEVDSLGIPQNLKIEKDICEGCGNALLSQVKNFIGQWIPAQIDGRSYASRFVLPVKFELEQVKQHEYQNEDVLIPLAKRMTELLVKGYGRNSQENQITVQFTDGFNMFEYHDLKSAIVAKDLAKYLYLNSSNLTILPDKITSLNNLKLLDLRNNKLEVLPEKIHRLSLLQELLLDSNKLKYLPENFHNLKSLTVLSLPNNQFEIIPVQVCQIKNLRALDLSNNKIQSIPMDIKLLKTLEVLALANNMITSLPEELYELKQLKRLYLEGNSLTESDIVRLKEKLSNTEVITK